MVAVLAVMDCYRQTGLLRASNITVIMAVYKQSRVIVPIVDNYSEYREQYLRKLYNRRYN